MGERYYLALTLQQWKNVRAETGGRLSPLDGPGIGFCPVYSTMKAAVQDNPGVAVQIIEIGPAPEDPAP